MPSSANDTGWFGGGILVGTVSLSGIGSVITDTPVDMALPAWLEMLGEWEIARPYNFLLLPMG